MLELVYVLVRLLHGMGNLLVIIGCIGCAFTILVMLCLLVSILSAILAPPDPPAAIYSNFWEKYHSSRPTRGDL